jgi:hypothetical protein
VKSVLACAQEPITERQHALKRAVRSAQSDARGARRGGGGQVGGGQLPPPFPIWIEQRE